MLKRLLAWWESVVDPRGRHDYEPGITATEYHIAAAEIADLLREKEKYYGKSVNHNTPAILAIIFPNSIPRSAYPLLPIMMRMFDKISRWANKPEGDIEDTGDDIAGLGILGKAVKGAKKG